MTALIHEPIVPIPDLDAWAAGLGQLAAQQLTFADNFPALAQRHEAWWRQQLEHPLVFASFNTNPGRPITRRLDLLHDPAAWLDAKKLDLHQLQRFGDTLPAIRVDFGAVMLGGLLGGATEFGSDTTWTHAYIDDDWSNAPDWQLRENHPWWQKLQTLLATVADDARGNYLLCTPDLGGSADVLLNLRGSSQLCMDSLEQPQRFLHAVNSIYRAWRKTFIQFYRHSVERHIGLVHWLGLWSNQPYMIPACDFNYMIGPEQFDQLCLPDIARQAETVGRAVFHLDGPGAARHVESLLRVPAIRAIQFTPGAGSTSALAWVDMFRRIQSAGRSVLVLCPAGEAVELARQLDSQSLALIIDQVDSPQQIQSIIEALGR